MMTNGSFVISLDFELMWGMIDVATKNGYGQTNVKNVPQVIDRLLALFHKYGVHATFATVGFIMYKDKESLLADVPAIKPSYDNSQSSPYEHNYIQQITKDEENLFFQPDVVKKLKDAEGIEIGTHTYCHYYCWEKGQTIEQFEEDIKHSINIAKRQGINVQSIVFPRNQVSDEYLKVCAKYGITSYRGNAVKYFNEPKSLFARYKNRICRFFDAYLNIGGFTSIKYGDIDTRQNPINIQASRMLRPYVSKLAILDGLRFRRMKKEMLYAAQKGEMYHIWWHPHNFGAHMEENMSFLEQLLQCYQECHKKYGMKSYTMNELCESLRNQ